MLVICLCSTFFGVKILSERQSSRPKGKAQPKLFAVASTTCPAGNGAFGTGGFITF